MKTVGLRELKNHLSAYVRRARNGEPVAVTDRGDIVAELVPPRREQDVMSGLVQLARRGELRLARPATRRKRRALLPELPPVLRRHSVQELLDAERGKR